MQPGDEIVAISNSAVVQHGAPTSIFDRDVTIDFRDLIQLQSSNPRDLPAFSDHHSVSTVSTRSFADDEQSWRRERTKAFYNAYMNGEANARKQDQNLGNPQSQDSSCNNEQCHGGCVPVQASDSPPKPIVRNNFLFRPKARQFLERHRSFRSTNNQRSLSFNSVLSDLDSATYRASSAENDEDEDEDVKCKSVRATKALPDEDRLQDKPQPSAGLVEMLPGVNVQLRGSDETQVAVRNDFYGPVVCADCELEFLCIADAAYALCPICQTVNPILDEHFEGHPVKRSGLGLGFTFDALFDLSKERLGPEISDNASSVSCEEPKK